MQSFQKRLLKKSTSRKRQQLLDDYQKQIQSNLKRTVQTQKLAITQLSTSNEMISFFGRTYTIILTAIFSSAIIYPLSAILPILANWNALLLGVTQGYINYNLVKDKYPLKEDIEMAKLEKLL